MSNVQYDLQLIENRIMSIATIKGLSKNKLLMEVKLNKSIFDNMKKGRIPSVDKIHAIADYLDCPVDYLLGRTNDATNYKKNNPPIVTDEEAALNEELISRLVQLTPEEQTKVGAFVLGLLASRANGTSRPASGE